MNQGSILKLSTIKIDSLSANLTVKVVNFWPQLANISKNEDVITRF